MGFFIHIYVEKRLTNKKLFFFTGNRFGSKNETIESILTKFLPHICHICGYDRN